MKGDKEMDKIIKKVNEYAKLSKERELTEEEKKDRDKYRKLYMVDWKVKPYQLFYRK